jgi:hypothetical protein
MFARVLDVPMSFFFEGAPEAQITGNRKGSTKGSATSAYVVDFLTSREGQDIIKAFIKDRKPQRKIIDPLLGHRSICNAVQAEYTRASILVGMNFPLCPRFHAA